jgi:SAM-dependent methyltransferase
MEIDGRDQRPRHRWELARIALSGLSTAVRGRWDPPPSLMEKVGAKYFETGEEFARHFVELGGLRPTDRVLDIGCGSGRMAWALADYLRPGSYEGFDIDRALVTWCRFNVTPRFRRFRFRWSPVYNGAYNPSGSIKPSEFTFPYPDGEFDFAFATSLFTHLLPPATNRYLKEIGRVLRPGGTCLVTFFLPPAEGFAPGWAPEITFSHEHEGALLNDPARPEQAVAYPEAWVRDHLAVAGLEVRDPIHYGAWSGRPDSLSWQDVVVARRRTTER